MKQINCSLFLKAIKYSGDNIGDDLKFSFRVFKSVESFELKLKSKGQKKFDPAKRIAETKVDSSKKSLRFLLTVDVTEKDEVVDDEGSSKKMHSFSVQSNKKYSFDQTIIVKEIYNRKLLEAQFTCSFELIFSGEESEAIGRDFPRQSAPITLTNKNDTTVYLDLSNCDRNCLSKCDSDNSLQACLINDKINLKCFRLYSELNCVDNCCNFKASV